MSVKQIVEEAIAAPGVVIFSKSYCPYCRKAKSLFASLQVPVTAIELDDREDGDDIQAFLAQRTGQSTVPNIFINQQHIGGNDTVQALHAKGQLAKMLKL